MRQKSDSARRHSGRERGIALVLVLWIMALLAVLAIGFAGNARTELRIARNQYDGARARAIANAGVAFAILGVLDPSPATRWPVDGRERLLTYGNGSIKVIVQNEGGKIDLNFAPARLLAGLLQGLGVDDPDGIVAAIVQWKRQRSAKEAELIGDVTDLGRARRRSDGPFHDVEELRSVPGITRALYRRLLPFVTTYSRSDRIDPLTAPPEVLRSIPGLDSQDVDAFLAARQTGAPLPPLRGAAQYLARARPQAVTVTSEGRTADGWTFVRQAVIALTRVPNEPYRILAWRRGRAHAAPAQDAP